MPAWYFFDPKVQGLEKRAYFEALNLQPSCDNPHCNKPYKRLGMIDITQQLLAVRGNWAAALRQAIFRRALLGFLGLLLALGSVMPTFFQYLQQRPGVILDDYLLEVLPAYDLSWPILGLTYSLLSYMIARSLLSPPLLLHFLIAYVSVLLVRIVALYLMPLEPPPGLVPLIDPGSRFFYGGEPVTKDLFFSGHTATAFLIYLCLPERKEKALALLAVGIMAVMLLIQHIHYTIDVLMAVPVVYCCVQISKSVADYITRKP